MKKFYSLTTLLLIAFYTYAQDGSLDVSFNVSGTAYIRSVQKLSSGKVIATHSNSSTGGIKYYNSDGTNYPFTFQTEPQQTGFFDNWIEDIIEQTDGKIVFIGANNSPKLFRYNADGTLDTQFQNNLGSGIDMKVYKGIVEPDGKIILIGAFTTFNNIAKGCIVRLNSDGTIDTSFTATGTPSSNGITDIIRLNDGKYYITGSNISTFNGQIMLASTIRLESNGQIDNTYQSAQGSNFIKIGLMSDNSIIGANASFMNKLNPDGTFSSFGPYASLGGNTISINQGTSAGKIAGLHIQNDNKIILTGTFNKLAGNAVTNHIVRLNIDGTVDNTFNVGTGPSHEIYTSQLTDDGKILIGGVFYLYNGIARNYIARLNNSKPPLKLENILAIESFKTKQNSVVLFPNPVKDNLFIQFLKSQKKNIEIFDATGKKVYSKVGYDIEEEINLKNLSKGTYILNVKSDGELKSFKIVKI